LFGYSKPFRLNIIQSYNYLKGRENIGRYDNNPGGKEEDMDKMLAKAFNY